MKAIAKAGQTSNIYEIFIQDSTQTNGAGLTGLTNASTGLLCTYKRDTGTASVAVTLVTITTFGTYVSGGFKEVDSIKMKGVYEFHPPDAALATGAKNVVFCFQGATNMVPMLLELELVGVDFQDAVHGGMSCLPNTAVTTNASLLTSGTGTDQLSVSTGQVNVGSWLGHAVTVDVNNYPNVNVFDWNASAAVALPTNFASLSIDISGRVDVGKTLGQAVTLDINNALNVNAKYWNQVATPALPAHFTNLVISAGGLVQVDPTQAIATTNTANTVGDCLNAARAQGFGKWVISGTTLNLYANDGTTVVRAFTLDSATTPTQRV